MTKTSVSLCISVTVLHMVFGTHVYNVDTSSNFFSFFQKSYFLVFSKFTNKYQKEILRYAPPSSHICDFLVKIWLFFLIGVIEDRITKMYPKYLHGKLRPYYLSCFIKSFLYDPAKKAWLFEKLIFELEAFYSFKITCILVM